MAKPRAPSEKPATVGRRSSITRTSIARKPGTPVTAPDGRHRRAAGLAATDRSGPAASAPLRASGCESRETATGVQRFGCSSLPRWGCNLPASAFLGIVNRSARCPDRGRRFWKILHDLQIRLDTSLYELQNPPRMRWIARRSQGVSRRRMARKAARQCNASPASDVPIPFGHLLRIRRFELRRDLCGHGPQRSGWDGSGRTRRGRCAVSRPAAVPDTLGTPTPVS